LVNFDDVLHVQSEVYNLKGIIEHHGCDVNKGHFTATLKCGKQLFDFNDEQVSIEAIVFWC
jgi:ubiquitin C-terminal hydrolase